MGWKIMRVSDEDEFLRWLRKFHANIKVDDTYAVASIESKHFNGEFVEAIIKLWNLSNGIINDSIVTTATYAKAVFSDE